MNRTCNACNTKNNKNNYLKERIFGKSSYNMNRRKNKNQQTKIDNPVFKKPILENNFENKTCHRHVIVSSSGHGKSYEMKYFLLKKQGPIFIFTKPLNQYPNIRAQITDEIQPFGNYENSTVVFDDTLLSKQESIIDLFFT